MDVIRVLTLKMTLLEMTLHFLMITHVLNLTSYTVCQSFGKKQLYSVALVLQKYTFLIPFSTASTCSLPGVLNMQIISISQQF